MTTDMNGVLIPNNAFDLEYSTQFKREMLYLWNHGFKYTFKKYVPKYGIPIYKYTKTPELFRCIADFYETSKYIQEANPLIKQKAIGNSFANIIGAAAVIKSEHAQEALTSRLGDISWAESAVES